MGTAASNQASPNWLVLYEEAVLEVDLQKIQLRISEAERGVMDRIEAFRRSGEESESEALLNALSVLRDLRRMATEEPK